MSEALPVLGKEICLFLRGQKKLKKSQKIADLGGDENRKKLVGFFWIFDDFSGFLDDF